MPAVSAAVLPIGSQHWRMRCCVSTTMLRRLPAVMMDRVGAIERRIDARLADVGRGSMMPQAVVDHLAAIERRSKCGSRS